MQMVKFEYDYYGVKFHVIIFNLRDSHLASTNLVPQNEIKPQKSILKKECIDDYAIYKFY